MKKIITFIMAMVMMLTMSMTAMATEGDFVSSPSLSGSPILVEYQNEHSECTAVWIVTPYADKATLPDTTLAKLEECYSIIKGTENILDLTDELASVDGATDGKLVVSEVFDVSYYGCRPHDEHRTTFTIKSDSLDNFVALLHYGDGEWDVVDDTSINGDLLTFNYQIYSPFAIVVKTDASTETQAPTTGDDTVDTGDSTRLFLYGAIMLASLVGVVAVVGVKARSSKKSER